MLQRVWAKMDYGLDVCRVTKGGHVEHLRGVPKKKKVFLFPSVGRVLTVLSANQVYRCYEMRQGIINNTEFIWEGNTEVREQCATCVT
jgi:hypothetical protein